MHTNAKYRMQSDLLITPIQSVWTLICMGAFYTLLAIKLFSRRVVRIGFNRIKSIVKHDCVIFGIVPILIKTCVAMTGYVGFV